MGREYRIKQTRRKAQYTGWYGVTLPNYEDGYKNPRIKMEIFLKLWKKLKIL